MKKIISVITALFFIFNVNAQYVPEPNQQVVADEGKDRSFHPSVTVDNTRQNPVPVTIVNADGTPVQKSHTRTYTKKSRNGDSLHVIVDVNSSVEQSVAPLPIPHVSTDHPVKPFDLSDTIWGLPIWAWILAGIAALFLLFRKKSSEPAEDPNKIANERRISDLEEEKKKDVK